MILMQMPVFFKKTIAFVQPLFLRLCYNRAIER